MNAAIRRVFAVCLLLFVVLIAFTSRWTIFEATALRHNPLNRRPLILQERIHRGEILADDGTVLAFSKRNSEGFYERFYPYGSLFAVPIGYSFTDLGRTGLEAYRSATLNGEGPLTVERLLNEIQGKEPEGDNIVTTLDFRVQQVAAEALAGYHGAVVAIEPSTGAVLAMVSSPSYNPNQLRTAAGYEALLHSGGGSELVNRATEYGFAPGSTFKVVTATAAFSEGLFTPNSMLSGANGILIDGVPLHNDNNESFGEITLTKALALSVDTVWAQVAERVGKAALEKYMRRFGFYAKPQIELPASELSASGEYEGENLVPVTSPTIDVGRTGIGQDKLRVTPLQMAEVAATIANHGTLMVPHLTAKVTNPEGVTVETVKPRVEAQVMKPAVANEITEMMEAVVREGTGVPAQIPGIAVAGKTGTAETQFGSAINDAWFIAFAPAREPKVAVAVAVEKVPGYGATYAAPVAKRVIETALGIGGGGGG